MDMLKKFGPSAVLAVVGMKASEIVGFKSPWGQIAGAVGGAFAGLVIASKL